MNMHASWKTNFVAPVVATPLPKTEAFIPPTPPCVRRALPFNAVAAVAGFADPAPPTRRGRWDSARAAAGELFTNMIPSKPAATRIPTQLELHFV